MKFEKISNDKIRIILNLKDLEDNDLDYQSFMANSSDTQKLFMEILDKAEEQFGFKTKDYKIMVEALATIEGDFIITITRSLPDLDFISNSKKKLLKVRRKAHSLNNNFIIYEFSNFDDLSDFILTLKNLNMNNLSKFTKDFSLYTYKDNYYLVMENINKDYAYIKLFLCTLTEFGKNVNNAPLFKSKLSEYGNLLIKNNVYKVLQKNFK